MSKSFTHFSHRHPLYESTSRVDFTCKACEISGFGELRYSCRTCNYNLHIKCAEFPETLSTFMHPNHQLTLKKVSRIQLHKCQVCKNSARGLIYRCSDCKFDMHLHCSEIQNLKHSEMHPEHQLSFVEKSVRSPCTVCCQATQFWRYQCEPCKVNIHPACMAGPPEDDSSSSDTAFGHVVLDVAISACLFIPMGMH